ncbi:helix-turn-helix domain-containing protein [Serratia sp. T13T92]|uniref:helix-turn-helix domain-containing protein n=1 Tax=Serratia sp. T13T92 TaxID=3397496 RepID=UPI0039DF7299
MKPIEVQENHVYELLNWIEENLCTPLSLDKISERSGYSKWHLQRIFKQHTNISIVSYIRARRLSLAAISLRYTQKKILNISLEYNFETQQTFSRCFKKHFGQTASAYRNSTNQTFTNLQVSLALNRVRNVAIDYE